jgi:2',3'-cyclic-nucleotide 2'-phosphodiesterase (5'-nucleotidase family)
MTVGNHEFDWSTSYVSANSQLANFPFLGINVFDRTTNQRVSYLDPSVVVNKNGAKIGIIGAIGDCYNSISSSMVEDVYFKVGDELSVLVKQEATRLRNEEKCDFIIFSVHDGSEDYNYLDYDYDQSLSNGYVDLVLEGHTHKNYVLTDNYGVYHIQCSANNKTINYINITINTGRDTFVVNNTKTIYTNNYDYLSADSTAESLFTKYASEIGDVNSVLGYNAYYRSDDDLEDLVASLYLQYGLEKWGSQYDIFLGGGYLKTRSPYDLEVGDVTYAMLSSLFTFDNNLVLCSISGYNLHYKFVHTSNSDYHVSYSSYGQANSGYITFSNTYYVVCDTYTSDYASNNLTVVDTYDASGFYARDMLANYASSGGFLN